MIKGRGVKRKIDPRSIWAGRQRHEISNKVKRIKGKIGILQNLLNKVRTQVELSRFLFIFSEFSSAKTPWKGFFKLVLHIFITSKFNSWLFLEIFVFLWLLQLGPLIVFISFWFYERSWKLLWIHAGSIWWFSMKLEL